MVDLSQPAIDIIYEVDTLKLFTKLDSLEWAMEVVKIGRRQFWVVGINAGVRSHQALIRIIFVLVKKSVRFPVVVCGKRFDSCDVTQKIIGILDNKRAVECLGLLSYPGNTAQFIITVPCSDVAVFGP